MLLGAPMRPRSCVTASLGALASLPAGLYAVLMKGDRVEVVVDVGGGTRTFEIVATKAGRRVEVAQGRGVVEVSEVTRTGEIVRTGRFQAARVVAVVEHPFQDERRPARRPAQPGLL